MSTANPHSTTVLSNKYVVIIRVEFLTGYRVILIEIIATVLDDICSIGGKVITGWLYKIRTLKGVLRE
jgi:hypothetical protein